MRLDAVKLTGPNGDVITLPLTGLDNSSRYILKAIDGLGPPDIDVGIKTTLDGAGIYQSVLAQGREIVMLIRLNPNVAAGETVSDLRTALYAMIPMDGNPTEIDIMYQGAIVVETTAWVSKFESNIFASDSPESEVVLTMPCFIPWLAAPGVVSVNLTGLSKSAPVINNPGNAPSGFYMAFTLTAAQASGFTITDAKGRKMFINYSFLSGDQIQIDTIPGARSINVVRSGVTTNLIQYLSSDSDWLLLHGGNNTFTMSFTTFNWTNIYYIPFYWGI